MNVIIDLYKSICEIMETQTLSLLTRNYSLLESCTNELQCIERSLRNVIPPIEWSNEESITFLSLQQHVNLKKAQNDLLMKQVQRYMVFLHEEVRYL